MRRIAKIDVNQPEIVKEFRVLGCSVQHLHVVGRGCPDILVGFQGINILVEIKDGLACPSKRKLTKDEKQWHEMWQGQVCIVESRDDAFKIIEDLKVIKEKEKGMLIDENCRQCGSQLLGNAQGDKWCSNIKCTFGVDYIGNDAEIKKRSDK